MKRILSLLLLATLPACAVELSLVRTNITMPAGRTFQMPITADDVGGGLLRFSIVSINSKSVTGAFAAATNRSLVLNVTGVDATNAPFTGDVVIQLTDDLTSNTTARIVDLVNSNFYNGQPFDRVIQDFVCQAGNTNGYSGATIDDEYAAPLTFIGFGQIALAKSSGIFGGVTPDSADSGFFITDVDLSVDDTNKPSPRSLTFRYPIFGQVTRGFDLMTQMMSTPVTNDTPVTPLIINTATIVSNSQDAVLRLSASSSFVGTVNVTISAMNSIGETATQTFQVKVIPNTVNDPAFLGPIPPSLLITQSMAASFILTTVDLEGDPLRLGLEEQASMQFPTNFLASVDPSGRVWFVPDLNVTGVVSLVIGVTDQQPGHGYDTQPFSITIVPKSETPTMTLFPKSGSIISGVNSNDDRIKMTGTFTFSGSSDHTFTFEDMLVLAIGDPGNPFMTRFRPDKGGLKVKNGVAKFKSAKGDSPFISAQFNSVKGTFKLAVSQFDFPAPISNEVQVGITVGNDYGTDTSVWTQKKPGTFTFPKP